MSLLQQLERESPSLKPMLVFTGLWCMADKAGRFEWDPDILHLDIVPFIPFDMSKTLELLRAKGFIAKYTVAGRDYGVILSFSKHQRITGKEHDAPPRYPEPPPQEPPLFPKEETSEEHPGNVGETPGNPGKGKGKGKGKDLRVGPADPLSDAEIQKKFSDFWKFYPQAGRHAKAESLKKFSAIVRKGREEELISATNGYVNFLDEKKNDENFDQRPMYAKTFLNGRWEEFIGYKRKVKL